MSDVKYGYYQSSVGYKVVSGGTTLTGFLKANGTVDNNTYALGTHNHSGVYIPTSHVVNAIVANDINNWNLVYNYGILKNTAFDSAASYGVMIADDYLGGEAGLIHEGGGTIIAGINSDYYQYGSTAGWSDGISIERTSRKVGVGAANTSASKLRVVGSTASTQGFVHEAYNTPQAVQLTNGSAAFTNGANVTDITNDGGVLRVQDYFEDVTGTGGYFDGSTYRHKLVHLLIASVTAAGQFDLRDLQPGQRIVLMNIDDSYDCPVDIETYSGLVPNVKRGWKSTLYVETLGSYYVYDESPVTHVEF